jgi:large conductance mechanosensitive channel
MAGTDKKPKGLRKIGNEFKTFITRRGSIADLAAGIVIGGAFGTIISSLVNDVVMPFVGILMGGFDFSSLAITVGNASINYGKFLQAVLNFIIIAICVFIFVKAINSIQVAAGVQKTEEKAAPKKKDEQLVVLQQIRDELKKK